MAKKTPKQKAAAKMFAEKFLGGDKKDDKGKPKAKKGKK